jgi:hypothetical protein
MNFVMSEDTFKVVEKHIDTRVEFQNGVTIISTMGTTPIYIDDDLEFNQVRSIPDNAIVSYMKFVANKKSKTKTRVNVNGENI